MQFLRIYGSAPGNSTSHWLYGYIVCMLGKKIACVRRRQWHPLQYFAWKIPWTEEPGKLQSMGSLRVGHDWVTSLSLFTFLHWEGNGNPLQCSCLGNSMHRGAWQATVLGMQRIGHDWMTKHAHKDENNFVLISYYSNVYLEGKEKKSITDWGEGTRVRK